MEFLLQWLDEIDDFVIAVAAQAERLRRLALAFFVLLVAAATLAVGALMASANPAFAPLLAGLLLASLLYRRQAQRGQEEMTTASG